MNTRDKAINELLPRVRAEVQKTVEVGQIEPTLADEMRSTAAVALVEFVTENIGRADAPEFAGEAVAFAYLAADRFRYKEVAEHEQLADDVTKEVVHELEGASSDPLDMMLRAEQEATLGAARDKLTARRQEVLRLRYDEGLTQQETAKQLKLVRGTVAEIEQHATRQMRDRMERLGFEKSDFLPDAVTSNALKGKRSSGPFVASDRGDAYRAIREWLKDVTIHEQKYRTSSEPHGYARPNWDAITHTAQRIAGRRKNHA